MRQPDLAVSRPAQRDLLEIDRYTRERWGAAQADVYLQTLKAAFHAIVEHPDAGRRRTGRTGEYRSRACGSHLIIYRIEPDRIVIHRILHERMDMQSRTGLSEEAAAYVL